MMGVLTFALEIEVVLGISHHSRKRSYVILLFYEE